MKKILLLSTLFLFFGCLLLPSVTFGVSNIGKQTEAIAGDKGAKFGEAQDPRAVISGIISVFLGITGSLLTVYVVYGGYMVLTSAGNTEKIDEGRNIIRNAAIGMGLVLMSYGIVLTVTRFILTGDESSTPNGFEYRQLEDPKPFERDYQYNTPDNSNFFAPPNI
jgi:hypothetical protein